MFYKLISLIFTIQCMVGTVLLGESKGIPTKDYLSIAWADYANKNPGSWKAIDKETAIKESKKLTNLGINLNKQKKYSEAIQKFEEAIDYHATGELYYNYANTLSNIPRLEDSIKAWEIANTLNYSKPELALYNIACSYSRLNQPEAAFEALAVAVDRGYSAFNFIQKDPDMENLRKRSDWKERINALLPKSIKYSPKDFEGKLTLPGIRVDVVYYFCKNGTVVTPSLCTDGFDRGKWVYEGGDLKVSWSESCELKGIGKPLPREAGNCDYYKNYTYSGCSSKVSLSPNKENLFTKLEIQFIKNPDSLNEAQRKKLEETKFFGKPNLSEESKEILACNPSYKPKTKADLVKAFE